MDIILEISFLAFNNADIMFKATILTWRFYNIAKALLIAKQMELINNHKFVKITLDKNSETFLIHVVALETPKLAIYPLQTPLLATL